VDAVALQGAGVEFYLFTDFFYIFLPFFLFIFNGFDCHTWGEKTGKGVGGVGSSMLFVDGNIAVINYIWMSL